MWIGSANLAPALRAFDAHRDTVPGVFLLVCECVLLVGSGSAIALGVGPCFGVSKEVEGTRPDWGEVNARRMCKLAFLSLFGLAWGLGSLQ